ncbi:hypothetical protein GEMRC1_008255 [Eukaryota sp. GEM-RC1]
MSGIELPEGFLCSIHTGLLIDPVVLPCGHSFCRECIQQWILLRQNCPSCRNPAHQHQVVDNYQLRDLIRDVLQHNVIPASHIKEVSQMTRTPRATVDVGIYDGREIIWKRPFYSEADIEKVKEAVSSIYRTFKALNSPSNVVNVLGLTLDPPGVVQERLSCSLQDFFNSKTLIEEDKANIIIGDITSALLSFHTAGIAHRDISAGNVLLLVRNDTIALAKLGDYDDSRTSDVTLTQSTLGTVAYMAPEVLLGKCLKASTEADIFSLGVLFWGILTNKDPSKVVSISARLQVDRITRQGSALIDLSLLPEPWQPLIQAMVDVTHNNRPSIDDVMKTVQEMRRSDGNGTAQDLFNRGESAFLNNDFSQAIHWFQRAAALGHADATCSLGFCYLNGKGVTKNLRHAVLLFQKAGTADSYCALGHLYEKGIGVCRNRKQSVQMFPKSC